MAYSLNLSVDLGDRWKESLSGTPLNEEINDLSSYFIAFNIFVQFTRLHTFEAIRQEYIPTFPPLIGQLFLPFYTCSTLNVRES
jgi:hypothetical protein